MENFNKQEDERFLQYQQREAEEKRKTDMLLTSGEYEKYMAMDDAHRQKYLMVVASDRVQHAENSRIIADLSKEENGRDVINNLMADGHQLRVSTVNAHNAADMAKFLSNGTIPANQLVALKDKYVLAAVVDGNAVHVSITQEEYTRIRQMDANQRLAELSCRLNIPGESLRYAPLTSAERSQARQQYEDRREKQVNEAAEGIRESLITDNQQNQEQHGQAQQISPLTSRVQDIASMAFEQEQRNDNEQDAAYQLRR